jgi:hypothetical protein
MGTGFPHRRVRISLEQQLHGPGVAGGGGGAGIGTSQFGTPCQEIGTLLPAARVVIAVGDTNQPEQLIRQRFRLPRRCAMG